MGPERNEERPQGAWDTTSGLAVAATAPEAVWEGGPDSRAPTVRFRRWAVLKARRGLGGQGPGSTRRPPDSGTYTMPGQALDHWSRA
jgi:hypothetical protein